MAGFLSGTLKIHTMKSYIILASSVSAHAGVIFKEGETVLENRFTKEGLEFLLSQKAIEEVKPPVKTKKDEESK